MQKEKIKNYVIVGFAFLILVFLVILIGVSFLKREEKVIRGSVIGVGDGYVILSQNDMDYILKTTENYPLGTILEVWDYQSDADEVPEIITNGSILLVERVQESIPLDLEDNDFGFSMGEEIHISHSQPFDSDVSLNSNEEIFSEERESNDTIVLNYLESIDVSISEQLKDRFVTVVDFLFYQGEIKGIVFQDITTKTKLIVLKYALMFDEKMDSYFPDYKENISQTTHQVYTGMKEKMVLIYLNITAQICESNSSLCAFAKQDFQSMKDSFGISWSFIKGLASSGTQNLKDWYEVFRGK